MFFYNPTYLLFMAPAFLLMMLTSWYVKSAYNKWSRVQASSRLTGAQAAQRLLSTGGMYGVQIRGTAGNLTDHYDPRSKTLRVSSAVAGSQAMGRFDPTEQSIGWSGQQPAGRISVAAAAVIAIPASRRFAASTSRVCSGYPSMTFW